MSDFMHVNELRMLNHGTRNTALFFEKYANMVKPGERPYYLAMCRLIAEDPEMFYRHAFVAGDMRFRDFEKKGCRLVRCKAYYIRRPAEPSE